MLAELNIRNFALIERQRVPVGAGLCVISGGTGAGKSLVVDALKFVLGARGTTDAIRAGADEAEVEALFYVDSPGERARVAAAAPALAESSGSWEGELVLSRSINRAGRSRATVNGRLVPVGALADLGARLVEVCGQHDAHALFAPAEQREIVDLFGGLLAQRETYARAYEAHRAAEERLRAIETGARDRAVRRETLEFQVGDLRALAPKAGELPDLEVELARLESAAKIRGALRSAYVGIYESDAAVLAKLRAIGRELEPLRALVPELGAARDLVAEAEGALEEAALKCRDLRSRFRLDEDRREEVDERISAYRRASGKYARSADELAALLGELEDEFAALDGAAGGAGALRSDVERLAAERARSGAALSAGRKKAAARLGAAVAAELDDLGMPGAALSIDVEDDPRGPGPLGLDRVEMRIKTNAGDEAMPLRKIASGGEASRVMLALKACLAGEGSVPTLVFDEVDANVGGRLGTTIGRKLRALAARWQVLCVTHLPQIASFADHHLAVSKAEDAGRTVTAVAELDEAGRLRELAQMIRGEGATEQTLAEARDMIAAACGPAAPRGQAERRKAAKEPAK